MVQGWYQVVFLPILLSLSLKKCCVAVFVCFIFLFVLFFGSSKDGPVPELRVRKICRWIKILKETFQTNQTPEQIEFLLLPYVSHQRDRALYAH